MLLLLFKKRICLACAVRLVESGAAAQVVMPEQPRRHSSPGLPEMAYRSQLFVSRPCGKPLYTLDRYSQGQVAAGPDVRAAQRHQQVYIRSPVPYSFDLHQLQFDFRVRHRSKQCKVQAIICNSPREIATVCCFLAAEADALQARVIQFQKGCGRKLRYSL